MLGSRSSLSETEERLAAELKCGGWQVLRSSDGAPIPRATEGYDLQGVVAKRLDGDA
jgi:hypothetical protein